MAMPEAMAQEERAKGKVADDQSNRQPDREITRQIRRAVVEDKSLSMMAHQAKIITKNGQVTLRGVVRTEEEKKALEEKAAAVAGAGKVTNQLKVSPNASSDADANRKTDKTPKP